MFIVGIVSGVLLSAVGLIYYTKKITQKFTRKQPQQSDKMSSVKERLKRVQEITQEQMDIQSYAERPQKNSLDGKYKNRSINEMERLDEEKQEILMSILRDGMDPSIGVIDDAGQVKSMKLSEYVAEYYGYNDAPIKNKQPEVRRDFSVIKGGKESAERDFDSDDDDSDSGNQTH